MWFLLMVELARTMLNVVKTVKLARARLKVSRAVVELA